MRYKNQEMKIRIESQGEGCDESYSLRLGIRPMVWDIADECIFVPPGLGANYIRYWFLWIFVLCIYWANSNLFRAICVVWTI